MNIEITDRKDNPLLDRVELRFKTSHETSPTPRREEIRQAIAQMEDAKKDLVVIDHLDSQFGLQVTKGYAKIYRSLEKARDIEPDHILKRNKIFVEKKKKEE